MIAWFIDFLTLSAVMAAVAAILVLLSRTTGKKFTAACRYIVWCVVIIRLCLPLGGFSLPALFEIELSPALTVETGDTVANETASSDASGSGVYVSETTAAPDYEKTVSAPAESLKVQTPSSDETPEFTLSFDVILTAAAILWFFGVIAYFIRSMAAYFIAIRKINSQIAPTSGEIAENYENLAKNLKLKRYPALYTTKNAGSPMLCGFLRPKIIIPANLTEDASIDGILTHELIHFSRRDLWIKLACVVARSLHWFNPLVHIAAGYCLSEMELSCDEKTLAGMSDETRLTYASSMLNVVKACNKRTNSLTTGYSPDKNAVKARFSNILDSSGKRRGRLIILCAALVCTAAGAIVACNIGGKTNITWDDSIFDHSMYADTETVYNAKPDDYLVEMTHDFIREELDGVLPDGDFTVKLETWTAASMTSTVRSNQIFRNFEIVYSVSGDIGKVKLTDEMNIKDEKLFMHRWKDTDDLSLWRQMITLDTQIPYQRELSPEEASLNGTLEELYVQREQMAALSDDLEKQIAALENNSDAANAMINELDNKRTANYAAIYELDNKINQTQSQLALIDRGESNFPTKLQYVCWLNCPDGNKYMEELLKRLDEIGFKFENADYSSLQTTSEQETPPVVVEDIPLAEPITDTDAQSSIVSQYQALLDSYRDGSLPNAMPEEAGSPYRVARFPDSPVPDGVSWEELTVIAHTLDDMYWYSLILPLENDYCMCVYAYGDGEAITLDELDFYYGSPDDAEIEQYGFGELALHSYYREAYQTALTERYGETAYTVDYQSRTQGKDFFTVSASLEGGKYVTLTFDIERENGVESYSLQKSEEFDARSATPYEFLVGNDGKGALPSDLITDSQIASIDSQLAQIDGITQSVSYETIVTGGYIYQDFKQNPYLRLKYDLTGVSEKTADSQLDAVFMLYLDGAEYSQANVSENSVWDDFEWRLVRSDITKLKTSDDSEPAPAVAQTFFIEKYKSSRTDWDGGFYHLYLRTVDGYALTPLGGCYWVPSDIELSDEFYRFTVDKKYADAENDSVLRTLAVKINGSERESDEDISQALRSSVIVGVDGYIKEVSEIWLDENSDGGAIYTFRFAEPIDAANANSVSISVGVSSEIEADNPLVFESKIPGSGDTLKVYTDASYPVYYVESGGKTYGVTIPYPNGGDGNDSLPIALISNGGKTYLYVGMSRGRYSYERFECVYSGGQCSFVYDRRLALEEVISDGALKSMADTVTTLDGILSWKNAGYLYDNGYNFLYDLLSGKSDIPEYNSVKISDFTLTRYIPGDDHVFYLDFTVTDSGIDTLSKGKYHREIHDIRDCYMNDTSIYQTGEEYDYSDVTEVQLLRSWFSSIFCWDCPDFGKYDEYAAVVNYLVARYGYKNGSGGLELDEFKRLAEEKFGIKPSDKAQKSIEGLIYVSETDGKTYVGEGGIGGTWGGKVIDVSVKDKVTTVTYQFYLDCNNLIKAKKVAYRFGENETWLGCEVLEDSGYAPFGLYEHKF